jgi:hypothetical protein
MQDFAKRLMAYEALGNKSSETTALVAVRVAAKLRSHLTTWMGHGGFHALLLRALALAVAEASWLRAVRVTADGSLEGLEELHARLDPNEFFKGGVVLLAQLFGLLVAFIGENLTLRLVREVWPKMPLNDLESGDGGKNEEK